MAKFFSLLLASALLFMLTQARPEPASSEENNLDSSEEDSVLGGLGVLFATLGLEMFVTEKVNDAAIPVITKLTPSIEKVIKEAEKVTPQSDIFKKRIAKLTQMIESEKKNDETSVRKQLFLDLDLLFQKYNALDDANTDDAFFKKIFKENGIEEIATEFHYRKVVLALDLFPKIESYLEMLRKDSPSETKDLPTAEQIHEKFASLDLKEKEALVVDFVKTMDFEPKEDKE